MGLSMGSISEIAATGFNQLTLDRRAPMTELVMKDKNARNIVKRLQPTDQYLFGGSLAEVARNLKDSTQLNALTGSGGFGKKFSANSNRGGGSSFRGRGFGFRNRRGGSFRGRAGQFGNKKDGA